MNLLRSQPFDSRQLLSFVTVARTRSFTDAGKELFLSQSAVSHSVKALETELGQCLLDREGKKLQITPAGEHFLHFAERILLEMGAARVSLQQRAKWGTGHLRVGVNGTFGSRFMPAILRAFIREFPGSMVSVKAGDTRECVDWLEDNVIDLAIVIEPRAANAVTVTPLFTDEIHWIAPPDHPWARAGSAVTEEIASQNFICQSRTSHTSSLLVQHFERQGIRLKFNMELSSLWSLKEMVKAGAGITALAPWAVNVELDEKSLVALPLGKRKLKRNWSLLRSPRRTLSLAEEVFARCSRDITKVTVSVLPAGLLGKLIWLVSELDLELLDVVF